MSLCQLPPYWAVAFAGTLNFPCTQSHSSFILRFYYYLFVGLRRYRSTFATHADNISNAIGRVDGAAVNSPMLCRDGPSIRRPTIVRRRRSLISNSVFSIKRRRVEREPCRAVGRSLGLVAEMGRFQMVPALTGRSGRLVMKAAVV